MHGAHAAFAALTSGATARLDQPIAQPRAHSSGSIASNSDLRTVRADTPRRAAGTCVHWCSLEPKRTQAALAGR